MTYEVVEQALAGAIPEYFFLDDNAYEGSCKLSSVDGFGMLSFHELDASARLWAWRSWSGRWPRWRMALSAITRTIWRGSDPAPRRAERPHRRRRFSPQRDPYRMEDRK